MTEKINLLIDTNAFSLLSMLEFRREKLIKLVFNYFNAYTCKKIFEEFGRRISSADQNNKFTHRLLNKKKGNILPLSYTETIEKQLYHLGYFPIDSQNEEKDKGERHLVCTAIENVYQGKFSQCIVLSEDHRAIEGFLRNIAEIFPFGYIWSVFDLVMFLFLKYKINYDEANYAVRELASSTAVSVKKYNDRSKTPELARQLMLKDQVNRLNSLNKVLNSLPRR